MDKHFFSLNTLSVLIACLVMASVDISASGRKVSMDEGWKFYRGCVANAEQPSFNDAGWRVYI